MPKQTARRLSLPRRRAAGRRVSCWDRPVVGSSLTAPSQSHGVAGSAGKHTLITLAEFNPDSTCHLNTQEKKHHVARQRERNREKPAPPARHRAANSTLRQKPSLSSEIKSPEQGMTTYIPHSCKGARIAGAS